MCFAIVMLFAGATTLLGQSDILMNQASGTSRNPDAAPMPMSSAGTWLRGFYGAHPHSVIVYLRVRLGGHEHAGMSM